MTQYLLICVVLNLTIKDEWLGLIQEFNNAANGDR